MTFFCATILSYQGYTSIELSIMDRSKKWLLYAATLCMLISNDVVAQLFPTIKQKTQVTNVGLYKELDFNNSYLLNVDIGKEYRIRTWFSFGGEANIYKFTNDEDYSTIGLGIRPVTRIYFFTAPKFEIFGETKGGIVFMIPQYADRAINFTFISSLGTDLYLLKKNFVRIAAGYNHFSNGKRYSDLRNPSFDGLGLNVSFVRVLP